MKIFKVQKEKIKTPFCAAAGTTHQHGSETCTVSGTSGYKKYNDKKCENDSMYQHCEGYKNFLVLTGSPTYGLQTKQNQLHSV